MARLDHLTVRGFKSIRTLENFELRGLNVLIGANGAGKSNLLSLLRMLKHVAEKRLQRFVEEAGGAEELLFGGRRRTPELSLELVFDGGRRRYTFSLEATAGGGMVFGGESVHPGVAGLGTDVAQGVYSTMGGVTAWAGGRGEARLVDSGRGDVASAILPDMRHWSLFHFRNVSRGAPVRQSAAVGDSLRLREDGGNLAPFLRRLRERHPEHYRRVIDAVRDVAPSFGDFVYRDGLAPDDRLQLAWFDASDLEAVLGPHHLSDGTLRFVCLAALLLQPAELQPTLMLIDEPELGQHPATIPVLAGMLRTVGEGRQVVVATQSADLLSGMAPEDVVVAERRDGASVFGRLDGDGLRERLKDHSLGDLWRMNVIGGGPGSGPP